MCLSAWLRHPNDSSSYCAQCEWKVEEIAEFNLRRGRREALEDFARLTAKWKGGTWTANEIEDALRALAKEPKP